MNERIQQLWEESQQWNGSDDGRGGLKILESVEKFAELIVADVLNEVLQAMDDGMDVYDTVASKFGVEEQVNDSKELHTCPYREEIHNDYESLCDCDEEQQHQCAMDI